MPCVTPDEDDHHIESRRVCKLIIIFNEKLGIKTDPEIIKWSKAYFENHCDKVTPILCEKIKSLNNRQLDKIVYNGRDPESRKLADWWDNHRKFDESRKKLKNKL